MHYKGKNISDVLNMTVEEALDFFSNVPKLHARLQTLMDVGLSYIRLGQSSTTLSGGEAQRVKLATELSKRSTGNTVYVLDEPTTGLHMADVHRLIEVLDGWSMPATPSWSLSTTWMSSSGPTISWTSVPEAEIWAVSSYRRYA